MTVNPPPANVDATTTWLGASSIVGIAEVLPMRVGSRASQSLFEAAGLLDAWRAPPPDKVADAEWRRLQRVLRDNLGLPTARAVAWDAGTRAANLLLDTRLPRWRQALLRRLPATLAAHALRGELLRLAWIFAGNGQVQVQSGRPTRITIRGNPMCRDVRADEPACDFVVALLERLFRVLVHPGCQVVESACESCGAAACRFDVRW